MSSCHEACLEREGFKLVPQNMLDERYNLFCSEIETQDKSSSSIERITEQSA